MAKSKTRMGVLVRESMGTKSNNQSADLAALNQNYQLWAKKIRSLAGSLQAHHAAMAQIERTRVAVSKNFAAFSEKTPLFEAAGAMPSADRPSDTVSSYASIHDVLSAKNKAYLQKYHQFVIEYVLEWEKVVVERINNGLKVTEGLRRDLDHYQKKVESLRLTQNKAIANGKQVKSDAAEKLKRNEEKLIGAKQNYNRAATDLCILMEEVTERSWRDVHPLLLKCAQFDMTLANDEAGILASLSAVVSTLKTVATSNGLSPQPRLKDLAKVKPELLSTRPGGIAGLTIEAGPSMGYPTAGGSGFPSTTSDPFAQPPGTVAPQGMGGFPVAVASTLPSPPGNQYPSQPSSPASFAPAPPPSLSMMTISGHAAPPPTIDDVYSASRAPSAVQSAPNSGNLPPLGPSAFRSSSSFNDYDNMSAYSGQHSTYSGSAAAPAGAPPPPPGPPPPPPPGGVNQYGAPDPPSYGQSPWSQGSYADPPASMQPYTLAPAPPSGRYAPPPPGNYPNNPF